jgi:hypothetical protein
MAQVQAKVSQPRISASDRLGFTLFLALTLHAIVVLGVGFTHSDYRSEQPLPSLDIILANSRSYDTVENPDYLAQIDQAGGGNANAKARPSAPVSSPTPVDQKGLSDRDQAELHKQQLAISKLYFLTQKESDDRLNKQQQLRAKDSSSDCCARYPSLCQPR